MCRTTICGSDQLCVNQEGSQIQRSNLQSLPILNLRKLRSARVSLSVSTCIKVTACCTTVYRACILYIIMLLYLEVYPHEGYGKADCMCVRSVCLSIRLTCNATKKNSFYSHVVLDFDLWISKLKLLSRVMACLLTVKTVAVFQKSFIASSVRTNFLFNLYELAMH